VVLRLFGLKKKGRPEHQLAAPGGDPSAAATDAPPEPVVAARRAKPKPAAVPKGPRKTSAKKPAVRKAPIRKAPVRKARASKRR
jgi:hypothetical protein